MIDRKGTLDLLVLEAVRNGGITRYEILWRLNQDPRNAWLFKCPYVDRMYNAWAGDEISKSLQRLRTAGRVRRVKFRWEVAS